MKKLFKNIVIISAALILSGCSIFAGVDSPVWLDVCATGKDNIVLEWGDVEGATSYIINVTSAGHKVSSYIFSLDDLQSVCNENGYAGWTAQINGEKLNYDQRYKFSVSARKGKGIFGPSTVKVELLMTYVDPAYNKVELSSKNGHVNIQFENLIHHNDFGPDTYGSPKIRYKIFREKGTVEMQNESEVFVPVETILFRDSIKTYGDIGMHTFNFDDTTVEPDYAYRYKVLPYNLFNWTSDTTIDPVVINEQGNAVDFIKISPNEKA